MIEGRGILTLDGLTWTDPAVLPVMVMGSNLTQLGFLEWRATGISPAMINPLVTPFVCLTMLLGAKMFPFNPETVLKVLIVERVRTTREGRDR